MTVLDDQPIPRQRFYRVRQRYLSNKSRDFGISRKSGNKHLNRYQVDGRAGLRERSRRPKSSLEATADLSSKCSDTPAWTRRQRPHTEINIEHPKEIHARTHPSNKAAKRKARDNSSLNASGGVSAKRKA